MFFDLLLLVLKKVSAKVSGGFRGGAQGAKDPPFGGIFAKDL